VPRRVDTRQDGEALGLQKGLGAGWNGARDAPPEPAGLGRNTGTRLHRPLALMERTHALLDALDGGRDSRPSGPQGAGTLARHRATLAA